MSWDDSSPWNSPEGSWLVTCDACCWKIALLSCPSDRREIAYAPGVGGWTNEWVNGWVGEWSSDYFEFFHVLVHLQHRYRVTTVYPWRQYQLKRVKIRTMSTIPKFLCCSIMHNYFILIFTVYFRYQGYGESKIRCLVFQTEFNLMEHCLDTLLWEPFSVRETMVMVDRCERTTHSATFSSVLQMSSFTFSTSSSFNPCRPTENIESFVSVLYLHTDTIQSHSYTKPHSHAKLPCLPCSWGVVRSYVSIKEWLVERRCRPIHK